MGEAERLLGEIEAGLKGVTPGPWSAWGDDYTVRVDACFIPEQRKIALCATGDGAGKNSVHLARQSPDNWRIILAYIATLTAERDKERARAGKAEREYQPCILENQAGGIAELVLRDCAYVVGEQRICRVIRDMHTGEEIGFQWDIQASALSHPTPEKGE